MEDSDEQLLRVSDLLRLYPSLGLPHFQRGGVWPDSARGRLLESLFHDTPCGSIILWKPADAPAGSGAPGLPLPGNREQDVEWLVIDGQQRMRALRAMLGAFHANDGLSGPDDPEEEVREADTETAAASLPKFWCLNLQALAPVAPALDGRLADQPLFVRIGDPRRDPTASGRDHRNPRYRTNLWPLSLLLAADRDGLESYELRLAKGAKIEDVWRHFDSIVARARAIATRRLLVVRRREDPASGRFGLDEVVELYNRINSAGVRVESEERAFAALVRIEPQTSAWLADLFEKVHGDAAGPATGESGLRDLVLRRAQERSFGFRFFLRSIVHAASYHLDLSLGSNAFSFELLSSSDVLRRLARRDEAGRSAAAILQQHASSAVLALARILREDLHCDGFQFLRETESLVVPMQILLAYGDSAETAPLLRWIVLALMLAEPRQPELMKLVRALRAAPDLSAFREILLERPSLRVSQDALATRLEASNAVQDRFVLLLYWLVRRNRARDLSYKNAAGSPRARSGVDLRALAGREALVEMNMHGQPGVPQKQHIVPFVLLASILENVKRSGSSPANNIGNFTYISPALNHYDGGIGAAPMQWGAEPADNLRAHLLLDDAGTDGANPLRDFFEAVIDEDAPPQARASAFDSFCVSRRRLIARRLCDWLAELRSAAESSVPAPAPPVEALLKHKPPAKSPTSKRHDAESVLEIVGVDQRAAATAVLREFTARGFLVEGFAASIQLGFRTDDGRFHSLLELAWSGFWLALRKRDRQALTEAEAQAFDRGACDFGPFFRPEKISGCPVKPTVLAAKAAEFADYLAGWRERILSALRGR